MKKANIPRYKTPRKRKKRIPGESPGIFVVKENALPSKIKVYIYDTDEIYIKKFSVITEIYSFIDAHKGKFCWIDIQGLGTQEVLDSIKSNFSVNPLIMEDVVNTHQRPKFEEFKEQLFVVTRMLDIDENMVLKNEQLSIVLNETVLITFQEDDEDILDPIRKRLQAKGNSMRSLGPSYLLYAIIDVAIDHNFNLINRLGDELEIIEDEVYGKPQKSVMYRIQGLKKIMLAIRRVSWPERDKLNEMLRSSSPIINPEVKLFLRDVADHNTQIIDLLETYRESSTTLMDIYLTIISNKMNEVMKILTVISAIFIPLTFIAGIYGMNFAHQDPITGKVLPNNMPELYWANGYIYIWGLMIILTILQIIYFIKKGWFRD